MHIVICSVNDLKSVFDYIRRIIYKFLNVCPFDYTAVAVSGKVGYP